MSPRRPEIFNSVMNKYLANASSKKGLFFEHYLDKKRVGS